MTIQFEGAIEDISPRQLEFITSILEKLGCTEEKAVVSNVGIVGDNFMASIKRIKFEKEGKKIKIIAKVAHTSPEIRTLMKTAKAFRNEHVLYTELLPRLTEIEIIANVPEKERLRYAACYGSFNEELNEVILLEDLNEAGYTMLDRFKPLTDHEVKLILKSFAKLHASSYALKCRYPVEFALYRSKLNDFWEKDSTNEQMSRYFEKLENDLQDILKQNKYKVATKGAAKYFLSNLQLLKTEEEIKFSTIMHGDSWTNNIMFRFEGNESVETCLIDYQICKYSVPPNDLHYMLFNCTDYETRTTCFTDWMDFYHSQLDSCLNKFGLEAKIVYPRAQLDVDMKRHAKVSLGQAAMLSSMLIRETKDSEKLKDIMQNDLGDLEKALESTKVSNLDDRIIANFRRRMEGVIDSFLELGYITV